MTTIDLTNHFTHRKFHKRIEYHVTLDTIFSVASGRFLPFPQMRCEAKLGDV